MRCTACGTEASPEENVCPKCGQTLLVACPSCAWRGPRDALYRGMFCGDCGAYVGALDAVAAPLLGSPGSERKHATVLFADVVGSTAAVAELDPEDAMARLAPMIDAMRRVTEEFEGTLVRVTGDGILALFGAPRTLEGHAILACRAALAMHTALAALPAQLPIRIGIHSGDLVAAATSAAALGDGAFGAALHLASRLEQLAPAGSTCVSAETQQLVRSHFELASAGRHHFKGFAEPIAVYELRGFAERAGDRSRPAATGGFAGRAREMAILERALDAAGKGEGRVVAVSASPGVGKSRLCREFAVRCGARRVRVVTMRAQAYGHAMPYLPVLELLRTMLHVVPAHSDERSRRRVRRALAAIDHDLAADVDLVCEFLGLAGPATGIDAERRQIRLLAVVDRLVRAPSARPRVVVVEDLHWLDAGSERFVRRLVAVAPSTRTLVVLNFRPGYDATWLRGPSVTLLPLRELGARATRALTLELIGADPRLRDLRERVAVRSGGNPLFIGELVRSLRERGVLAGDGGNHRIGDAPESLELPSTIRSVLGARIDVPAEHDREVLHAASVIGVDFHLAVLQPIVGRSLAELETSMANLCAAELVEPVSSRDPVFAFRHPLVQEVAYATQLKARRATIHLQVARAIEGFHSGRSDEISALLAHHYEAAGQPVVAAQYLVKAALWIGKTDSTQALGNWKHACELVRGAPTSVANQTLRVLVNAQVVNYGWRVGMAEPEARRYSLEARHHARELGDRQTQALLLAGYGRFLAGGGSADSYVALVEEALGLIADSGELGRIAILKGQLAQANRFAGWLGAALRASTEALRGARKITALDAQLVGFRPVPWIMALRGSILVDLGRFEHARKWLDRVIALGELEPVVEYIAHMATVRMAWFSADFGLADRHARKVAAIAEQSGVAYVQVYALRCLGLARSAAGDAEGALGHLRRALKLARQARAAGENEAPLLAEIAEAELAAGRIDAALECCRQGVALARRRNARIAECHARIVEARALRADPEAKERAAAALDAAERLVAKTGAGVFDRQLAALSSGAVARAG